jgi:glycosyltransferase involved in cell wall biosynthesis
MEQGNILYVLKRSVTSLKKLGMPWEIIVVDNHSRDNTANIVSQFIQIQPNVRLIIHDNNQLYSGSCKTAIQEAKGTYIAIMDSDRQVTAEDIPKFLAKLKSGANLVIGWRRKRHDSLLRFLMSWVFNKLGKVWLRCPLHDLNCGFRMFDRNFAAVAEIQHRINMVNPELYVRARCANQIVDEVEIQYFKRTMGITSHNLLRIWDIFLEVNKYIMALRRELDK